jgi:nucleotide-binding universal stress UspA family protein
MKPVIALTDFTPAADNATHYAAKLSKELGAPLSLLHVYQIPITMSDMPVIMVSAEELKSNADSGLLRVKQELINHYPDLQIATISRIGDVADEVHELTKEETPIAVVLGRNKYSGLERALFGSTAISLLRGFKYPVITVPENFVFQNINNIVLATDLQNIDATPVDAIQEIFQHLPVSLHILHVSGDNDDPKDANPLLSKLQSMNPQYHLVHNSDVTKGIEDFVEKINAGLLLVLPHHHKWFESLFTKQHSKDIIRHVNIPVLTIAD